jgi:glycosyltransferase involved in cell wall biosynthesis
MPQIDILIPSFNNAAVLPYTLGALYGQALPDGWTAQVIISDDGSTDASVKTVKHSAPAAPFLPPIILPGEHAGVAAARNRALEASQGNLILFLGADIVLAPGVLSAHIAWHEAHAALHEAALGMVVWDPESKPTVCMEWMVHGGQQNDFDALLGSKWADPKHFFYASHVSLKREFVGSERFSPDFLQYGWEDLDFGRTLAARGLRLGVLHTAKGYHRHRYTIAALRQRQYAAGYGLVGYQARRKDEQLIPPAHTHLQRIRRFLASSGPARAIGWWLMGWAQREHWSWPALFSLVTRMEYWHGIQQAQRRQASGYPQSGGAFPHSYPQ